MDVSDITGAISALTTAKQLAQGALALREFNDSAGAIAQINEQLLKAQERLFAHNAQLMQLQQEHFETSKELGKLKEALAERGRYSLFELSPHIFVYRVNVTPELGGAVDPRGTEPQHYVCQPCFDKGIKHVLQGLNHFGSLYLVCGGCKSRYFTGEKVPY